MEVPPAAPHSFPQVSEGCPVGLVAARWAEQEGLVGSL